MAIVGFVVSAATGNVGARYAAMMGMVSGAYASYVVGLAWVSNTLPRPTAKVSDFSFSPFLPFSFGSLGERKKRRIERFGVRQVCALEIGGVFCCVNI